MKQLMTFAAVTALTCQVASTAQAQDFRAQQFKKTADIIVNGSVSQVFPLFGAFEEKKWASRASHVWDKSMGQPIFTRISNSFGSYRKHGEYVAHSGFVRMYLYVTTIIF